MLVIFIKELRTKIFVAFRHSHTHSHSCICKQLEAKNMFIALPMISWTDGQREKEIVCRTEQEQILDDKV